MGGVLKSWSVSSSSEASSSASRDVEDTWIHESLSSLMCGGRRREGKEAPAGGGGGKDNMGTVDWASSEEESSGIGGEGRGKRELGLLGM